MVTRLCTSAFLFKSLYEFRLRRRQYARCATEPPSRSGAGLNTINQHAQWTKKSRYARKIGSQIEEKFKHSVEIWFQCDFFSTFFNTVPCTIVLQNRHENDIVSQFRLERRPVKLYWTLINTLKMHPRDISMSDIQSLRHVEGAYELMEAMRANKSQEEIMRIILRNPRLMAKLIVSKSRYYK